MIACAAPQDLVVSYRADLVGHACAPVAVAPLPAYRYTGKIVAYGNTRFRTQCQHDLLPFDAVRLHPGTAIQQIDNVMGNFMGHGRCQIVIKIAGKNIRVVSNLAVILAHPVHAGCASIKVKADRDLRERLRKDPPGACNTISRAGTYLAFELLVDGFDGDDCFRFCHWRK